MIDTYSFIEEISFKGISCFKIYFGAVFLSFVLHMMQLSSQSGAGTKLSKSFIFKRDGYFTNAEAQKRTLSREGTG